MTSPAQHQWEQVNKIEINDSTYKFNETQVKSLLNERPWKSEYKNHCLKPTESGIHI